MKKLIDTIKKTRIYKTTQKVGKKLEKFASNNPFKTLFALLAILFAVIALSSFLNKPKVEEAVEETEKLVAVYMVGESPRVEVSAKVEESNVITIVAQAGGVVQSIGVEPGQRVYKGQQVAGFSSDYYGGNAATIQRQLAEVQNNNLLETYDSQIELIEKQREVANLQAENSDELRRISEKSVGGSKELLELNEEILAEIDTALSVATDSSTISSLKSQKSQLLSGINQIKNGLRQAGYQGDEFKPPFQLALISKEMTLKQLELQEKSLEMSKEISNLQLKLARVQEATMYPGSPCSGTVERVFIKRGQLVAPGTPIATIKADEGTTQLVARVSQSLATKISITEPTIITIDGEAIEIYPDHVSTVPTDGLLYSVVYSLDDQYQNKLINNAHTDISIPIGSADTNSVIPFLPLESINQSERESTIFVLEDGKVVSKNVQLGTVSGRFVEIREGLDDSSVVILDRNVIEGQKVKAAN